jgi:hypothetical protein
VDTRLTLSTGTAERDAAIKMMEQKPTGKRLTLGRDRETLAFGCNEISNCEPVKKP